MKITHLHPSPVPAYQNQLDLQVIQPRFDALVEELAAAIFPSGEVARSLSAGLDEIATMIRSVPTHEGRLLERGIAILAEANPSLVVLNQNIRLPVTKAAVELVEKNDPTLYRSLTLDSDSAGRKSYTPDLIILNRRTRVAHVVDVKRSLGSYETSRIADLKSRMLAASLIVPDLLYKEHRRLVAEDVRVVILNAANQRTDIEGGVWPLSHLDHLLEVGGVGEMMKSLRQAFRARVEETWAAALRSFRLRTDGAHSSTLAEQSDPLDERGRGAAAEELKEDGEQGSGALIRFGFARAPLARPG